MQQTPQERNGGIFTRQELFMSILQGIIIAAGAMILYYYFMNSGASLKQTKTIVFAMLILSNVFLTFANRSFSKTIFYTSRYENSLAPVILIISAFFLAVLHFVPFVRSLFQLTTITQGQFWLCFGVAFAGVMWLEMYKTGLLKIKS